MFILRECKPEGKDGDGMSPTQEISIPNVYQAHTVPVTALSEYRTYVNTCPSGIYILVGSGENVLSGHQAEAYYRGYCSNIPRYLVAGVTCPFHFHSPTNFRGEGREYSLYTSVLSALGYTRVGTLAPRSIAGAGEALRVFLTCRKAHADMAPPSATCKWIWALLRPNS